MPLITISGLPLSGKSTFAETLQSFLSKSVSNKIILLNDESLGLSKFMYSDPQEEKKARAALLSAVERHLTKETIVICDGLNYIKGFRYQLYCIARALGTTTCTVYAAADPDLCRTRHLALNASKSTYESVALEALLMRFEEPDDRRNRWDAPLFTVIPQDDLVQRFGQQIIDVLLHQRSLRPNLSTVNKPMADANFLHALDELVQDGLSSILAAQRDGHPGGKLKWSKSQKSFQLPSRPIPLTETRRLKRQFLNLHKVHTQLDLNKVGDALVEYLNVHLSE